MSAKKLTPPLLLVGAGADALDVRYASGFDAPDPFLFLLDGETAVVVVSILEAGRALRQKPPLEVITLPSLNLPREETRSLGAQAVALLQGRQAAAVRVSERCPVKVVRNLEAAGIEVQIQPDPLFPQRIRKRADELRALVQSQRAAVAAMTRAIAVLQAAETDIRGRLIWEGAVLTSERVRAEIDLTLLRANCMAEETIVAGGDQATDPHERGSGPLLAGQPVVLDIFPRHKSTGYWGDITRTVLKGSPTAAQRKLYQTVKRAQLAALRAVAPGVTGAAIHERVCQEFALAGYETGLHRGVHQGFIHSTGHGVGLEIHEAPGISPLGGPLEPGMVITIEPGLYYPGIGGVRIEDTVVVTETGSRMLATCPKVFVL